VLISTPSLAYEKIEILGRLKRCSSIITAYKPDIYVIVLLYKVLAMLDQLMKSNINSALREHRSITA
jgi:hypothetical protein